MTTSEKKKFLLILNLVKAVVMVDYVTTSKNKTKVLSVQLGKTLSIVKFVGEWGGEGGRGWNF